MLAVRTLSRYTEGMSKTLPPGGAQSATSSDHRSALKARDAQLGHVYYLNGDAVQVMQKEADGSACVQMVTDWSEDGKPCALGRPIRLESSRTLMRTTTLPAVDVPTPAPQPSAPAPIEAQKAEVGAFYRMDKRGTGDLVCVETVYGDGRVVVRRWPNNGRVSLPKDHALFGPVDEPLPEDARLDSPVPGAVPRPSAPVELPDGLRGTPKANPGGHVDRARIEAALPTMTDAQLKELVQTDKRAFVGPLVNNEQVRREEEAKTKAAQAARPASAPASPRAAPPVASAPPPTYPAPKAPRASPTPPPAPAAPADDRAERARSALAVISHHAPALIECAAAYKELEALGLTAPRFL